MVSGGAHAADGGVDLIGDGALAARAAVQARHRVLPAGGGALRQRRHNRRGLRPSHTSYNQ